MNKKSVFNISLLMGCLGYLFTPYQISDNVNHYIKFVNINNIHSNFEYDVFLYFLMKIISGLKGNFFWVQFIFVFLTYYIFLYSFYKFSSKEKNRKIYFIFFIQYFLAISFNDAVDGMRDYLSIAVCYYAILLGYLNRKKIVIIVLFLLAGLVHYMSYIYLFIYVFSEINVVKKYKYYLLFISIFLGVFFITPERIYKMVNISYFDPFFKNRILIYLSPEMSKNLQLQRSLKGIIFDKVYFCLNVVIPMFYLFFTHKIKNKIRDILIVNLVLIFIFFNFYTISFRLSQMIILLTIFELCINNLKNKKKWILLFLIISIIIFIINMYSYRIAYIEIIKYSYFNLLFLVLRENFGRNFLVK